jgi:hypothetical protein
MDYEIKITPKDEYIHVEVSGEANYNNALEMWQKVVEVCKQQKCYKILGEQNLRKTLTTSEVIDYPKLFKKAGMTDNHLIAWVDHNPRTRDTTEFIRDVLTNRFIGKGKLFNNLNDAKRWLLKETPSE